MISKKDYNNLILLSSNLYKTELKRHNDAGHPLNILVFLVDNGITKNDGLEELYQEILKNNFSVILNIPEHFGGTGKPCISWMSCDHPLMIYIAIKLNDGKIEAIHKKSIEAILSLLDDRKWKCKSDKLLGGFRGPGRKDDECPITTLNILKMLSLTKANSYKAEKLQALEILMNLWNERKTRRPYLFAMGTDFKKLKYPLIWYDILNLVSVLSRYPEAIKREEYKEMLEIVFEAIKQNGYCPQSVYQFWKEWDFGQKKNESTYIKKTIEEIIERTNKEN